MILAELEVLIRQIEIRKHSKVKTQRSGSIISARAGRGLDFKEVREYIVGDDTRHIDWNVSSRMGELYVKEYHQENDRIINIFLDSSASMFTGGEGNYSKFFIGFQFMAFATLLFLYGGDRIHLCSYSDEIEFISQAIKTKPQAYSILRKFYLKESSRKKTDHLLPFKFIKDKISRNSITYIISDFANLPSLEHYKSLMKIHDLNGIKIFDNIEVLNSDLFKLFFMKNPENGQGGVYHSSKEEDEQIIQDYFKGNLLRLNTKERLAAPIVRYLTK
ncbi:MAG: DUF58 domain-containing protein [Leptospiraceae bacterium]|nr:DUF58 domain-containing protein [Leptospiraceae bacterium]